MPLASTNAGVDALLHAHHGVITSSDLASLGLSARQSSHIIRVRGLARLRRGVYISPAHPATPQQLMAAACLAHPEVAIGFTTAGREWGYRGMTVDRAVHALVPHGVQLSIPGVVVHRCRRIDPVDVAGRRRDGIRLTSPPRTLLDAASIVGPDATESAIEQALSESRCTLETLVATSGRLRHHSRPGALVFEQVILSREAWRRSARSDLEVRVHRAIDQAGLPRPSVNHLVVAPDGSPLEIDLAWPTWTLAYEVDHPFWHDGRRESRRDKERDRRLGAMGWLPQRLTQEDIDDDLVGAVNDVAASLRARGWTPGRGD